MSSHLQNPHAAQQSGRPHIATPDAPVGRLLVIADHTLPIVHFTLSWRHGALTDAPGKEGALAALLPMLLRGTKSQSRERFHQRLELLGSTLDTSVGHELALLRGSCLSQHLAATVELLAEALSEPALSAEALGDFACEVSENLQNERDDDDALADLFLRRSFFAGTPLAQAAIGTSASLARLTPTDLARARAALCAPWAVLGFAGDVTVAQAQAAAAVLSQAMAEDKPQEPKVPALPCAGAENDAAGPKTARILLVDKPERTQVQVRVALPGLACSHPDADAFWLGSVAFGGTFTSPLTREVRDQRGWSYVAQADYRRRGRFASPLVLRTAPKNEDAIACVALELELLEVLAKTGGERPDLERAQQYLLGRVPFWSATAFDLLGPAIMMEVLGLPLSRLQADGPWLESVDLASVADVMRRFTANSAPLVVMVGSSDVLERTLRARFGHSDIRAVPFTDGV